MSEIEYEIGEVAAFLLDLQEEKFPKCEVWDNDPRDCNCMYCRIEHFAKKLDRAKALAEAQQIELANTRFVMDKRGDEVERLRAQCCGYGKCKSA